MFIQLLSVPPPPILREYWSAILDDKVGDSCFLHFAITEYYNLAFKHCFVLACDAAVNNQFVDSGFRLLSFGVVVP